MTEPKQKEMRCGDNEKRLIKQWCLDNNGMKTQDEFYLTPLGRQLKEQGFSSRSIAPVVIHGNKEVQKVQMGPNGTGVGAKRPPEDGITGASLNNGGKYRVVIRDALCVVCRAGCVVCQERQPS